jgi:hypothetical protein
MGRLQRPRRSWQDLLMLVNDPPTTHKSQTSSRVRLKRIMDGGRQDKIATAKGAEAMVLFTLTNQLVCLVWRAQLLGGENDMVQISPEPKGSFRRLGNAKTAVQLAASRARTCARRPPAHATSVGAAGHFDGHDTGRCSFKRRMSSPNCRAATRISARGHFILLTMITSALGDG